MTKLTDPTDLDGLREALAALDPQARLAPLGLIRVVISDTAHLGVAAALSGALGHSSAANVLILTDKTAIFRAGEQLSALVERQLSAGYPARTACLEDGHDREAPHWAPAFMPLPPSASMPTSTARRMR
jgi:hypothetical protein